MTIEPNDDIRNQGIRIIKNKANWDSFVLTGCYADPLNRDGVWKMGSTSSQFRIQKQKDEAYDFKGLIIDFDCTTLEFNNQLVAPLPAPPIDYAIQQTLGIGAFDFFTWGQVTLQNNRAYISIAITHFNPNTQWNTGYTLFSVMYEQAKPKFSGTPRNILLNAIMYITKQATTPVVWLDPIAIDCYIDPDGHIKINAIKQAETLRIYGAIYSNNVVNVLGFIIVKAGQEGSSSGLQINQYGNELNFYGKMNSGNIQINPTADGYDDVLRISRVDPTSTGNSTIQLGYSRTSTVGAIDGQWSIFTPPSSSTNNLQSFVIAVSSQAGDNTRVLQIRADGNTLIFNGRVL
ncbi:MAG: hypothetical protein EZS28_018165 [Streblomastix strix]|uniref:Uncharacterized protein n=1 Tax=Streblomastix strix TaxID=222440 RepID=A0A5J4VV66_9EUKA|nr:MAG: hypothetical protein EZS28_018165 [Streblomastix strix]